MIVHWYMNKTPNKQKCTNPSREHCRYANYNLIFEEKMYLSNLQAVVVILMQTLFSCHVSMQVKCKNRLKNTELPMLNMENLGMLYVHFKE